MRPARLAPTLLPRGPPLLTQFATVFVFLCLAIGFILVSQIVSWLLRPKNPYPAKQASYECGE